MSALTPRIDTIDGKITVLETTVAIVVNTSTTAASASVPLKYTNIIKDTHSAYSAGTGKFTAPVAGLYMITAGVQHGITTIALNIRVNDNSVISNNQSVASNNVGVSGMWPLEIGDTVDIVPTSAITAQGGAVPNNFMIARLGD